MKTNLYQQTSADLRAAIKWRSAQVWWPATHLCGVGQ